MSKMENVYSFSNQSFNPLIGNIIEISSSKSSISSLSTRSIQLYLVTIMSGCIISFSSMFTLFIFSTNFINLHNSGDCQTKKNSQTRSHSSELESKFDPHKSEFLKLILAFAVGSLIADVFLHILPEASVELARAGYSTQHLQHFLGVWVLIGLIVFASIETFFQLISMDDKEKKIVDHNSNVTTRSQPLSNLRQRNNKVSRSGPVMDDHHKNIKTISNKSNISATGYLNLLANSFDNFTHGMSIAASYLVSYKMGILTTAAIVIHEIPHEIVDFFILLRSGFSCLDAFRAQLLISLVTIIGSIIVLYFDQFQHPDSTLSYTLWILPLTSGGFIYIALTCLLPELLSFEETDKYSESYPINGGNKSPSILSGRLKKQGQWQKIRIISRRMGFVVLGIITMEAVNNIDL